jgi:hypothetical protein
LVPTAENVAKAKGGVTLSEQKKNEQTLEYEPPEVVTYSEDDILEELGPVNACATLPCPAP